MNLVVFGATGATGRPLVAQALERGHSVTAFVRSAPSEELLAGTERVVTGDARNPAALASALRDAEAVVSAMGPRGPDPGTVYSDAIGTIVRTMGSAGPSRLVISANSRVLDDRPLEGPYAAVSQEHRHAVAAMRASSLTWTVVCTPILTDDDARGTYDACIEARSGGGDISRVDFAGALLDAFDHPDWQGKVVDVTHAG